MIQANLTDLYYIKLRKTLLTHFLIENINTCHLSDLLIDIRNCIHQFDCLWVTNHLQLMVLKEKHDQIVIGHPGYQKTMRLITWTY